MINIYPSIYTTFYLYLYKQVYMCEQTVLHAVAVCVLKNLTLKTSTATGVWFSEKNSDGSGASLILSLGCGLKHPLESQEP